MTKFKAKHFSKLDNPERKKILPPNEVIKCIGLEEGMVIADVGCGTGYFTIPMSEVVGERGKVYALDISEIMVEEITKRLHEAKITNVEVIQSSENQFHLSDASVDMIFTSTVHHELDDPNTFLSQCHKTLKESGFMAVLDWNDIEESSGPPLSKRVPKHKVIQDFKESGFAITKEYFIGKSFYILVGRKE